MPYRVGFATLGCKVSQYETEAVSEAFVQNGFKIADFSDSCDVYVINTCTVTAESDRKSRQIIRRAAKTNPDAVIMVMGCYAQTTPQEVVALPVAYVSGTDGKMRLPQKAMALLAEKRQGAPLCEVTSLNKAAFEPMCITHAPRTRAYVKIEDGCECRCAYCAIPGARGPVRSKQPEDVLREVEGLAQTGTKEIVLTGIETASYGLDFDNYRLIDLLEMLHEKSSVERFRLGSLTPKVMSEDFTARLAKLPRMVPHYHLSMQSGSDAVLRGMRRRYNTAEALAALERLRKSIPGVRFTTDMMVGFPGESDALFEETVAFCQKASFLGMHVFAYSPRHDTPAATYPNQIPEAVKKERSARLIALAEQMRDQNLADIVQNIPFLHVLFETCENGLWYGHSDEFAPVTVPSDKPLHGALCRVAPLSFQNGVISGTLM